MDRKGDLSTTMNNFVGYVSDKASVGMAKLRGYESQEIDVAVVKATITEEVVPKNKHVQTLRIACSQNAPRAQVLYAIKTLAERLVNSTGWLVTLKTLMVFHRLIRECDPSFIEEIIKFEERTGHHHLLRLDKFADHQTKETWDYSAWIRAYSVYLAERLEAYRGLKFDAASEETKDGARLKTCPPQELLEKLPVAQRLLTRLVGCVPDGHAQHHAIVQEACAWVLLESRTIYRMVSDGMLNLVDKYFEMEHSMALQGLEIYKENTSLNERLNSYYGMITQNPGLRGSFQLPTLQSLPADFLTTMEEYVREAPKSLDTVGTGAPRRAAAGPVTVNRSSTLAARGGSTSSALGGTSKPPAVQPPALALKAPGTPTPPPPPKQEEDLLSFGSMSLNSQPEPPKPSNDPFGDTWSAAPHPPAAPPGGPFGDPGYGQSSDPFGTQQPQQHFVSADPYASYNAPGYPPSNNQGFGGAPAFPGSSAGGGYGGAPAYAPPTSARGFDGSPAFPQSPDAGFGAPAFPSGGAGGFGDSAFGGPPQQPAHAHMGYNDPAAANPFGAPAFAPAPAANPFLQQSAPPSSQMQPGFFGSLPSPPAQPQAPGSNPFLAAPTIVPPPVDNSNPFKVSATMAPSPGAFEGKKLVADPLNMLTDDLFGNKKVESKPAVPLKDLKKPGAPGQPMQTNTYNFL